MRIFFSTLVLAACMPLSLLAQPGSENTAEEVKPKIRVDAGEKIDFFFNRGLLLRSGMSDGVDITPSRSGTFSFGFSYNIPFAKAHLAWKIEPRATWHKLYFPQTPLKQFPTPPDPDLITEKLRAFYIELGTGLRVNLVKNEDDKTRFFLEAGVLGGYNLAATYKAKIQTRDVFNGAKSSVITIKQSRVSGFEELRYGAFSRIGTNWLSLYLGYRLSDILMDKNDNPRFSPFEAGFTLMF